MLTADSLIIATGGLSIPPLGATDFGYQLATQFALNIIQPRPALVPLTLQPPPAEMSGIAQFAEASYQGVSFKESILFTHRGLSGPAILQISSYMPEFAGALLTLDLLPEIALEAEFVKEKNSKKSVATHLRPYMTNRLIEHVAEEDFAWALTDLKKERLRQIAHRLHNYQVTIAGSEGYQKAEVTVGGVDTHCLSSKTMECKTVPGLYFIGEVVDVTGWLGGYNFQWAWSSGYAAGSYA